MAIKLVKKTKRRYIGKVHDLTVANTSSYNIDGIPVHNSAGGSLVAYLLGITDVDPIRFKLIFERFINPSRLDLPDIDLDFASSKRANVIEYITERFGEENVAGISNYITLGAASSIRDVGRAHGLLPFDMTCTKLMPKEHGSFIDIDTAAEMVPELEKFKDQNKEVWKHAKALFGNLRNYGKHAAGIVIAGEPVANRAIVEKRSGEMVVNWDKNSVEQWGLIKVDVLGLSTLDILDIARKSIWGKEKKNIDFLRIPLDDEKVLDAFGEAKTIGVFQLESGGMRNLLKSLGEKERLTFDDICAVTALYRPGPMDAGLTDQYVRVKRGEADEEYYHELTKDTTKDTFGVQVYQEQTMQISRDLCGFSMSEADNLRKIIGKKQKDKMSEMSDDFIRGAMAGSIDIELDDGSKMTVHRLAKFKCEDGKSRTAEEAAEEGVDITSLT